MINQFYRKSAVIAAALLVLVISSTTSAQRNTDPARWEETMQRFDAQDSSHPPPEGAVVLTGSSSIARWNNQAAEALAPLTVIPRGFGGSIMGDVLHHLDRVALRYKPRAILIYEGDNDTDWGIPEDTIVSQFEKIVARVHEQLPETRIYIMSVKPSVLREDVWPVAQRVSARFAAIAKNDPLVYYVDAATPFLQPNGKVMTDIFVEDNLHLNDMGNVIWGSVIRAALMPQELRHEK